MDLYETIKEYRKDNLAPVDIIGCESYLNKECIEKSKQNILTSLLLSSMTSDYNVFIAMINLNNLIKEKKNKEKIKLKDLLKLSLEEIKIKIKKEKININYKILSKISINKINKAIKNVGFHKKKSIYLKEITIKYKNKLPETLKEIKLIKGIGNKMGILYIQYLFNKNIGISVDNHVNRISNLLKIVKTKNNIKKTQIELEKIFKKTEWKNINKILVGFGQIICLKKKPKCILCPINKKCPINLKKIDF